MEFNYLHEKRRYLDSMGRTEGRCENVSCYDCMFYQRTEEHCTSWEIEHPEEATEMIKKWAEQHPAIRNADHVAEGLKSVGYNVDVNYLIENRCPPHMTDSFMEGEVKCDNDCEKCRRWWLEEYKGGK